MTTTPNSTLSSPPRSNPRLQKALAQELSSATAKGIGGRRVRIRNTVSGWVR